MKHKHNWCFDCYMIIYEGKRTLPMYIYNHARFLCSECGEVKTIKLKEIVRK